MIVSLNTFLRQEVHIPVLGKHELLAVQLDWGLVDLGVFAFEGNT
jgi:hypothetical protein